MGEAVISQPGGLNCAAGMPTVTPTCEWQVMQALLKECSEVKKLPTGLQLFYRKYRNFLAEPIRDEYQSIAMLGEGGYGQVELAEKNGQRVALKRMAKKDLLADLEASFDTELEIMASNLRRSVGLIEAYQTDDALCLAMEWMEGGSVADVLDEREHGLPLDLVRFYAMETALALEELHQAGFVHCDIKPGNLLLNREGQVRLADFGSAIRVGSDVTAMRGTPDYAAPEMLQMNGLKATANLDCWSLGVLIYEMLTGVPPFYHDQLTQTFARIEAIQVDWTAVGQGEAASLLRGLLCPAEQRLTLAQVKEHAFFYGVVDSPPFMPRPRQLQPEAVPRSSKPSSVTAIDGNHLAFAGWGHGQRSPFDDLVLIDRRELDSLRQTIKANEEAKQSMLEGLKHSASQDKLPVSPCLVDLQAAHECLRTNHEFLLIHYDQQEAEKERLEQRIEQLMVAMEELASLKQDLERDLSRERAKVHDLVGKLEQVMRDGQRNEVSSNAKSEVRALRTELQRLQQRLQQLEKSASASRVSRMPSMVVNSQTMEGELRWLEGRKWRRLVCSFKGGSLYSGDQCLLRLDDQVWWVQGVSRQELPLLNAAQAECAFKIRVAPRKARSMSSRPSTPQKINPKQLEAELEREQKIRDGALQLVKAAAANPDQARLAEAHVEAATKRMEALKLQLSGGDDASSIISTAEEDVHGWELSNTLGECACCQRGTLPGATLRCSSCNLVVHRECQGIVPVSCADAKLLQSATPIYLLADSREEAHRWRLAFK